MINLPEISNILNKKESSKINLPSKKENKIYDHNNSKKRNIFISKLYLIKILILLQ